MLLSDLDELRCVLCRSSFLPPHNLPHLLPCTHYICTLCLQRSSEAIVICPEDLQQNTIKEIRSNCPARRALLRLVKQHTAFNQSNQLFCIQSLSKHFQSVLDSRNHQKLDFKGLVQRIIQNQIKRLKNIEQSIVQELESPFKMVKEWKEMVREYLAQVKTMDRTTKKEEITNQLNYFVQQGRRIKLDLQHFQNIDFNSISNIIAVNPAVCLRNQFSLQKYIQINQKDKEQRQNKLEQSNLQAEEDEKDSVLVNPNHNLAQQSKVSLKQKGRGLENCNNLKHSLRSEEKITRNCENIHVRAQKLHSDYSIIVSDKHSIREHQNPIKSSKTSLQPLRQNLKYDPNHQNQNLLYDTKLLIYSLSPSKHDQQFNDMNSDEILLTEKEERKQDSYTNKKANHERYDFLQPWEITQSLSSQNIIIEKRTPFDWQKQRNSYIRKLQQSKVEEAVSQTTLSQNSIQLINYSVSEMDLGLYLQQWPKQRLQVIKFVKTGLSDQQLNELLNFMLNSKVNTLVLCGNCLGQISLDALLNYTKLTDNLRNVYLSKNQLNPLKGQTRQKISLLRQRGINLYI